MTPPDFDPEPGFPETRANAVAIKAAIEPALPAKVVFLSTVGAQVLEPNLLNNSTMTEQMLRTVSVPVALLRAGWYVENATSEVEAARSAVIPSLLQPLDHAIPMVVTIDIGRTAAELLRDTWSGVPLVELEGPRRYSARDIGTAFAAALGRDVRLDPISCDAWEALFRSQGMKHPMPRMRMIDGFNGGWIDFEGGGEHRNGTTTLHTVIAGLVSKEVRR
jgi:NAD(P)H dehydrogenase (quinone)